MTPLISLALTIPRTPSDDLAPNKANRRYGQAPRREAAALLRLTTAEEAKSQMVAHGLTAPLFAGRVEVSVAVFWEKHWEIGKVSRRFVYRRRPDKDALISMCKGLYDGLQDAGVIANDRMIDAYRVTQDNDPHQVGYCLVTVRTLEPLLETACATCTKPMTAAAAGGVSIGLYCFGCGTFSPTAFITN